MSDRLEILNTIANVQTLQGQCSILMITAAEQKFDEKKIVRGPGGKFGEKKDEKKEPPSPSQPQISPEKREKQKQLNEQVEKITNTAREFAFGKNAVARMQGMVNSLKGRFDKNQVFREAQNTSQHLQGKESLDKVIEEAKDKIQDLKNADPQSNGMNQWQATGIAIGLAVAVGGILGVVQKKKALKIVEDIINGKKNDLDIEGIAKGMQPPGGAPEVEEVTQSAYKKLKEFISANAPGAKAKKAAQELAEERALQKGKPSDLQVPVFKRQAEIGFEKIQAPPKFKESYNEATKELFAVADNYAKKESCVAIDLKTGKRSKLLQEGGASQSVSSQTLLKASTEAVGTTGKPADVVLLHTHPQPGGLSPADFGASKDFAWVHAVDTHGNVYQGKMLKGSAQDIDTILAGITHIMSTDKKFNDYAIKYRWVAEQASEFNMLACHTMAEYAKKRGLVQHEVNLTPGWNAFMERHNEFIQDLYAKLDTIITT